MIDTLEFADKFESAAFEHDKARALASAFARAGEARRYDLVTMPHLDKRLAELEARLTRAIADNGREIRNRLRSAIAAIAGISTAISATVGAAVALILRNGM